MIYDKISNAKLYKGINANLDVVLDYITSHNLNELEVGKTMIDGDNVYVNRMSYNTKDVKDCRFEGHDNYGDVQIVTKGIEYMASVNLKEGNPTDEYNPEKDIRHYSGNTDLQVKLGDGGFAVFFPEDLHMAKINSNLNEVDKYCFKFKI